MPFDVKAKARKPSESNQFIKAIIYGHSKIGKSVLSASAEQVPEMAPAAIIATEPDLSGIINLEALPTLPDVFFVEKEGSTQSYMDALKEVLWGFIRHINAGDEPRYKTLILDTLTHVYRQAMEEAQLARTGRNTLGKFDWDDYGIVANQFSEIANKLLSLPMHVIVVCHSEVKTKTIGKGANASQEHKTTLALSGKALSHFEQLFPNILYYEYRALMNRKTNEMEDVRYLQVKGSPDILAGVKGPKGELPGLVNPTMRDVYDLIMKRGE